MPNMSYYGSKIGFVLTLNSLLGLIALFFFFIINLSNFFSFSNFSPVWNLVTLDFHHLDAHPVLFFRQHKKERYCPKVA